MSNGCGGTSHLLFLLSSFSTNHDSSTLKLWAKLSLPSISCCHLAFCHRNEKVTKPLYRELRNTGTFYNYFRSSSEYVPCGKGHFFFNATVVKTVSEASGCLQAWFSWPLAIISFNIRGLGLFNIRPWKESKMWKETGMWGAYKLWPVLVAFTHRAGAWYLPVLSFIPCCGNNERLTHASSLP